MPASPTDSTCVVCLDRPADVALVPCGHDHFCQPCTRHFRTCPLCRAPLVLRNGEPRISSVPEEEAPEPPKPRLLKHAVAFWFCLWLFLFVVGALEWAHGVPASCDPEVCEECNGGSCRRCRTGLFNAGARCYSRLEDLPPISAGRALGEDTYFLLIVLAQVVGSLLEGALICRLWSRNLLPWRELAVLLSALAIEVVRIASVDTVMLTELFDGRSYRVFRVPTPCSHTTPGAWLGTGSTWYCGDTAEWSRDTLYYIAVRRQGFSRDASVCSSFTAASALLDFDEFGSPFVGHPRFSRLGWAIGGEFALLYLFATIVNAFADILYIIPTTMSEGWGCKMFAVSLELFQLGALCPAAVFTHGADCLHFSEPLGVPLHLIRSMVVVFDYATWGFCAALLSIAFALVGLTAVAACMILTDMHPDTEDAKYFSAIFYNKIVLPVTRGITALTCFMLLASGVLLGGLTAVSLLDPTRGTARSLTAIVLLSDLIFKVLATTITEAVEHVRHVRVLRVLGGPEPPLPPPPHPPPDIPQGLDASAPATAALAPEAFVQEDVSPSLLGSAEVWAPHDLRLRPPIRESMDAASELITPRPRAMPRSGMSTLRGASTSNAAGLPGDPCTPRNVSSSPSDGSA